MEGSHCTQILERGHKMPAELAGPTGGIIPGILWPGWPYQSFETAAALTTLEDVVAGLTYCIVVFTLLLRP